jgi:hypothetical protein
MITGTILYAGHSQVISLSASGSLAFQALIAWYIVFSHAGNGLARFSRIHCSVWQGYHKLEMYARKVTSKTILGEGSGMGV